jgi:hypothetical protein
MKYKYILIDIAAGHELDNRQCPGMGNLFHSGYKTSNTPTDGFGFC